MDILTDLPTIQRLADQRRDDFEVMRYLLELNDDVSDAHLDALVEQVAVPIIAAIDCTACANCCRGLAVYLVPEDAQRLAAGLHIPLDEIETRFIDRDSAAQVEEWGKFRDKPCAFLRGTLCSVYEHRPETCRLYPQFTPDFRWTLADTLDGAGACPIIYNVLVALLDVVETL
jgi:hypothetical protein